MTACFRSAYTQPLKSLVHSLMHSKGSSSERELVTWPTIWTICACWSRHATYSDSLGGGQVRRPLSVSNPFLGIQIDTLQGTLFLPPKKLDHIQSTVSEWEGWKACSSCEHESLVGLLNHACKVVRPGFSFLRRHTELISDASVSWGCGVDEAMIPFQGRSSLKQYLPKKPVKHGIKVWCLADSSNGYVQRFDV